MALLVLGDEGEMCLPRLGWLVGLLHRFRIRKMRLLSPVFFVVEKRNAALLLVAMRKVSS